MTIPISRQRTQRTGERGCHRRAPDTRRIVALKHRTYHEPRSGTTVGQRLRQDSIASYSGEIFDAACRLAYRGSVAYWIKGDSGDGGLRCAMTHDARSTFQSLRVDITGTLYIIGAVISTNPEVEAHHG